MKAVKEGAYRKTAQRMMPVMDEGHQPYVKSNAAVSRTRTPRGAWVQLWVWVPEGMAKMEPRDETKFS